MRSIPDNNLSYPSFISLDTGSTGSGFLLVTDDSQYLVTAKHVLYSQTGVLLGKQVTLRCPAANPGDVPSIYSIDLTSAAVAAHATSDVATIKIGRKTPTENGKFRVDFVPGIRLIQTSAVGTISADARTSTKLLSEVFVGNDVFLYGYPTSLGMKQSPQFDYEQPLLRKGIVANTYAKQKTLILDCPVYYGNSGGPVVEVENLGIQFQHKVIGVVSQFIPFVQQWHNPPTGLINTEFLNSGYSVAVPMDMVFETIGFVK